MKKYLIKLNKGGEIVMRSRTYRTMARRFLKDCTGEKVDWIMVWSKSLNSYIVCERIGL